MLIMTIVCVFKHQDLQMFLFKLTNMRDFQPVEAQPQVIEILCKLSWRDNGEFSQ